jgi:hypothetical protein
MANPFPFVAGEVLTAADMNGIGEWTDYTAVLTATVTNPTLGTGALNSSRYARIQNLIIYQYFIQFGTSGVNPGAGNYEISLPVNAAGTTTFYEIVAGQTAFYDSSTASSYYANAWLPSVGKLLLTFQSTFNGPLNNVTAAAPVVPAATDAFSGLIIYKAA